MSPSDFAALLRSAWLNVRFNLHPLVATITSAADDFYDAYDYSMYYPSVDASSAKAWAAETVVEYAPSTMSELVGSLEHTAATAQGSRPRLYIAPAIDSADRIFYVILILAHWTTDARGAVKIFNHILQHLEAPTTDALRGGTELSD
jgi:hypothetical protein